MIASPLPVRPEQGKPASHPEHGAAIVVMVCTAYPSEMGKEVCGKATMVFARDWVTSTLTHAKYPGSGPSCGGNTPTSCSVSLYCLIE